MNFPENIATNISKASGGLFIFYILYNSLRRVILSYYSNKRNIRIMLCHFCMLVECTLALELYTSMKWKTTSYHSAQRGEIILFHKGPTKKRKQLGSHLFVPTFTFLPVCSSGQRDQILFWNRRESPLRQAPLLPDDFDGDVVMIMMIILIVMVMITMMIRIRLHKKIQPKGVILDKNTKRPD